MSAPKKASPQAAAKAAQDYQDKPVAPTCANCAHLKLKRGLLAWMERYNAKGKKPWGGEHDRYTVEIHGVEKDLRCGIGGFAVKKMATCSKFEHKESA